MIRRVLDRTSPHPYRDVDVVAMASDRMELLVRSWHRHHRWLAGIRLVVADELHTVADLGRGARLYAALTCLRALLPPARGLGLTAKCGNPEVLSRGLGGVHVGGGERPVPVIWHAHEVKHQLDKKKELWQVLDPQEGTLVFVHARARTDDLARAQRIDDGAL